MVNKGIAFSPSKLATWILLNSGKCALGMVGLGVGAGVLFGLTLGSIWFTSFGAVTIALGVAGFGVVASDLLNRAQDGRVARDKDDPSKPFSPGNIRTCLNYQTFVVVLGTLQSGFGGLIMGNW